MPVMATTGRPCLSRRSPAMPLFLVCPRGAGGLSRRSLERMSIRPAPPPRRASGRPRSPPRASACRRTASRCRRVRSAGTACRSTAPSPPARHWPGTAPRCPRRSGWRWPAPRAPRPASASRSSPVAGSAPIAPEMHGGATAGSQSDLSASRCPAHAAVTSPGLRRLRPECTAVNRRIAAWRRAPRRAALLLSTRNSAREPSTMPPPCAGALPHRRDRPRLQQHAAQLEQQQHVRALGIAGAADQERCRPARPRCARTAMRTASTPAASSPMKVRDEPVTPCTMEMLPASRLESCARNRVGRRSLGSTLVEEHAAVLRRAVMPVEHLAVDRVVALAAAGGDDHVACASRSRCCP